MGTSGGINEDRNTKYFHTSIKARQWTCVMIMILSMGPNDWTDNVQVIQDVTIEFYHKQLSSGGCSLL